MQLSKKKVSDSINLISRQLYFAKSCATDFVKSVEESESCHLVAVLHIYVCFKFLDGCVLWKKCTESVDCSINQHCTQRDSC